MRTTLFAAAAVMALAAAPAFAQPADVGSEAYPAYAGQPGSNLTVVKDGLQPVTGSETTVQVANSLPPGFEVGTVAFAQARSLDRHFAAQAERSRITFAAGEVAAQPRS